MWVRQKYSIKIMDSKLRKTFSNGLAHSLASINHHMPLFAVRMVVRDDRRDVISVVVRLGIFVSLFADRAPVVL